MGNTRWYSPRSLATRSDSNGRLAELLGPTTTLRELGMTWPTRTKLGIAILGLIVLSGCGELIPHDAASLLIPRLQRSEIFGFVAGFGTTFAALPDLFAMLKRRSSAGMNARMAGILGVFQVLWIYYGLLIGSRPVIAWNIIAVVINFLSVWAYRHFSPQARSRRASGVALR